MTPLRAGVVGYGLAGRVFHCPLISVTDGVTLTAIVTADPARAAEARDAHPGVTVFASIDTMMSAEPELDLVAVATPNDSHASVAMSLLAGGVHVVVDKPIAVTSRDAEMLQEAARRAGVLLIPFQNRRWDGDFLTVSRLIADGTLGTVRRFESAFATSFRTSRPRWKDETPTQRGGGELYNLGPHLIDQALTLFGPAVKVYGELDSWSGTANDDAAFVSIEHAHGVRSHLMMGSGLERTPRFRVVGDQGTYFFDGADGQQAQLERGLTPRDAVFGGANSAGRLSSSSNKLTDVPTLAGRYADFYPAVATAVRGQALAPVNASDAVDVIRIIEKIIAQQHATC